MLASINMKIAFYNYYNPSKHINSSTQTKNMPKNQKAQVSPVLGCSREAPYTYMDLSKDIQVYHQTCQHHQNNIYNNISPKFVHSIELQDNASNIYNYKMKNLYMQELDHSLNMYKNKLFNAQTEKQDFRKEYKENVNGVVLAMEKDQARRCQGLKNRVYRQEQRQHRFIDADLIKNKKIDDYINNTEFSNSLKIARQQMEKANKHPEVFNQSQIDNQSAYFRRHHSTNQISTVTNEQVNDTKFMPVQNRSLVNTKNLDFGKVKTMTDDMEDKKQAFTHRILRVHNPITYPIEYHIDNPYFISKMQRKFGSNYQYR